MIDFLIYLFRNQQKNLKWMVSKGSHFEEEEKWPVNFIKFTYILDKERN